MKAFGKQGRFMNDAIRIAFREWFCQFLAQRGVRCFAEDGFHLFPRSGKASDIRDAFLNAAAEHGLRYQTNCRLTDIYTEDHHITGIEAGGGKYRCEKLILATGGLAMPQFGNNGHCLELVKRLGHTVSCATPAMAPVYCDEVWVKRLSGVSLPDSLLILKKGNVQSRGTILFTHRGLSGMAALNLSADVSAAYERGGQTSVLLRFDAEADSSVWTTRLRREISANPDRYFQSALLPYHFTKSL